MAAPRWRGAIGMPRVRRTVRRAVRHSPRRQRRSAHGRAARRIRICNQLPCGRGGIGHGGGGRRAAFATHLAACTTLRLSERNICRPHRHRRHRHRSRGRPGRRSGRRPRCRPGHAAGRGRRRGAAHRGSPCATAAVVVLLSAVAGRHLALSSGAAGAGLLLRGDARAQLLCARDLHVAAASRPPAAGPRLPISPTPAAGPCPFNVAPGKKASCPLHTPWLPPHPP